VTVLRDLLGLGDRELVSLVGGGGKSTMLFGLGDELAAAGRRVILTTTTKMGRDQAMVAPTVCWDADTQCAVDALANPGPVMLVTGGDDHKVTGPSPEVVDRLFTESNADYIIVEADGSRGRSLKAPAVHEPVVPSASTTVVILMGIDAVGHRLADVTHRVGEAMRFTGLPPDHTLRPADCATILTHPDGALRVCPPTARIIVALTKVLTAADVAAATEIERRLATHEQIDFCVQVGTPNA
jgi:probable selenium-dependent hydroxylase accessory protein YqeC